MNWPEADGIDDQYGAPAATPVADTTVWGRSRSGAHDAGRNVPAAKSVRRLKFSSVVHESTQMDTQDQEDHTFNGIMFDIEIPDILPIDIVRIDSVWVRGALGPMTVYVGQDPGGFSRIFNSPEAWTKVHEKIHPESASTYVELKLDEPLVLKPKDRRGIYIHSARPDDEGIVYDNSRLGGQAENGRLVIRPNGMAHLNPEPFNDNDPWGWGRGWRRNREFVGRVSYGVRWILWNPEKHKRFPPNFRRAVVTIFMGANRPESLLYWLPHEMIFFILNQMNWDAFGDELLPKHTLSRRQLLQDRFAGLTEGIRLGGGALAHVHLAELRRMFNVFAGDHGIDSDDLDSDEDQDLGAALQNILYNRLVGIGVDQFNEEEDDDDEDYHDAEEASASEDDDDAAGSAPMSQDEHNQSCE